MLCGVVPRGGLYRSDKPIQNWSFLVTWFSLSGRSSWMQIDASVRGAGAPGALVLAGLADGGLKKKSGGWPAGLKPGALLQLWQDEATYEAVRDGTMSSAHGHSLVFLGYASGGKAIVSDQIQRKSVESFPYLNCDYVIAANVKKVERVNF